MATSFSLGCCVLLVYWLAGTTLVREPVLLVQLVPVGGDGDPRLAVPGEHLLLLVQHSPQGMWAGGHTHAVSFRVGLPEGLTTPVLDVDGTGHVLVKGPGGGDDGCPHRLAPGG